MTVKDLRDSNKVSTKNANVQKDAPISGGSEGKKNMPCKKSLPT